MQVSPYKIYTSVYTDVAKFISIMQLLIAASIHFQLR